MIVLTGGLRVSYTAPCRVIDISKGGAQLDISADKIPDSFYLEMDHEPNNLATCQVVWRQGRRVGVKFL
jgi:hypothetical protein